jgi:hypothetical protein
MKRDANAIVAFLDTDTLTVQESGRHREHVPDPADGFTL